MKSVTVFLLMIVFSVLTGCNSSENLTADMLLRNAQVYTVNKDQPNAEAVAVKDGKIVFVGSNDSRAGTACRSWAGCRLRHRPRAAKNARSRA